jgi:dTDP-4-dehydrorhamnose reductase
MSNHGRMGGRIAVTGAAGQLGGYLLSCLAREGYTPIGIGRSQGTGVDNVADIADREALARALDDTRPDVIVHCAAYTDVDGCERNPELADAVNRVGSENVAEVAAERGIWVIGVSTDFVFSGDGGAPYTEDADPNPISVYGASKLAGERAIRTADPSFAVARTAWVYGGKGKHFPRTVLSVLAKSGQMEVVDDEIGNPTFAGDLAEALVALLAHRPSGVLHLTNEGATSRFDLARKVAREAGQDPESITPISTREFLEKHPLPARRPANSSLANTRAAALGIRLPHWEDAIRRYTPDLVSEMREPGQIQRSQDTRTTQ